MAVEAEEKLEPLGETEERITRAIKKVGALFSPEGILMMFFAVILDGVGVILVIADIFFGLGEIPSWISDGVGLLFIGGWVLARSGMEAFMGLEEKAMEARRGRKMLIRRVKRGPIRALIRPGLAFLGEIIPLLGVLPFWTWAVYSELTKE